MGNKIGIKTAEIGGISTFKKIGHPAQKKKKKSKVN